ncbi:polysaccharide deacetylase family protein [Cohnella nanjingensis]|uniref:Polysaccharide deacetylase family protein n=1 Tax=Cohnella nanjingensis TaxID=1387779 RepID=A0A7X0RNC0_9BACL|nr:polysaccharide deacetylase family protein [Cohnella nanjingensis]MBB6670551.1 polysaccharide deacetylase family protein [Cohnella nanjingensis]
MNTRRGHWAKRGKAATIACGLAAILLTAASSDEAHAGPKPRAYYESTGEVIWEVPVGEKAIALTFDDGPDPKDTPQILDLLREYDAKATFFIMGRKAREHPEIVKREALEGHEIANHTFTHPVLVRCSTKQIRKEIEDTQEILTSAAGVRPVLFRPPEGFFDSRVLEISKQQGLKTVLWSWHHPTDDWSRPGVGHIVRGALGDVRNGDIILFHDYVHGPTQTIAALRQILPKLAKDGYRFVTVSELLRGKAQENQAERMGATK